MTALSRTRLWMELLALFVGVPVLMTVFIDALLRNRGLFSIIWIMAVVALVLLWRRPGWRVATLWRGPVLGEWRVILSFAVVTGLACLGFVFALHPESFLEIYTHRPGLWTVIMIGYPLVSALPQEVIFRSLFFERYGVLFGGAWAQIVANGVIFGIGHLFYMNPVTIAMTAAGGAIMGWAYMPHRSMLLAWVLHALAGQLIFTIGLGSHFYHGAIGH